MPSFNNYTFPSTTNSNPLSTSTTVADASGNPVAGSSTYPSYQTQQQPNYWYSTVNNAVNGIGSNWVRLIDV